MSRSPSPPLHLEVQGKKVANAADHDRHKQVHTAAPAAFALEAQKPRGAREGASVHAGKTATASPSDAVACSGLSRAPHATSSAASPPPQQHPQAPRTLSAGKRKHTTALRPTVASATLVVAAPAAARGSNAIELSLVRNLKQQIACLEAQQRVMKQQQDAAARAHVCKTAGKATDGASSHADHYDATAPRVRGVTLPLPHAERVRHVDAAAGAETTTVPNACDAEVSRLRRIPEAYQLERSTLQHDVESLTKDIEGLQSLALDVGRERDVMAAEVVQLRAALHESQAEHAAMAAECATTLRLFEAEQALRRAAENDATAYAQSRPPSTSAPGSTEFTTVDAVSQRDYYRLQSDRFRAALAREKARAETLAAALLQERGRCSTQEKQLCSALDRIALMEKREHQLAVYYQSLSARFVTVSAMLRHVLDVVPEELLQAQRIPSPERAEGGGEALAKEEVTLREVRETLTAWHAEVLANAAQLRESSVAAATTAPSNDDAEGVKRNGSSEAVPTNEEQEDAVADEYGSSHSRTPAPDMMAAAPSSPVEEKSDTVAVGTPVAGPAPPLPPTVSVPVPPPPPSISVPAPPPPPTVSVPVPPPSPPSGVVVPPPSFLPPPPTVEVPTGAPTTAPAPPSLEQQLSQLDARIDAQSTALAELVQRHKESASS
ncbi:hypothetical protein N2W54_007813 [Lotmaria passim]